MFLRDLAVNKSIKCKREFSENYFHIILKLFGVLTIFLSLQVKGYTIITYKHDIYQWLHEFSNDLRLGI